MMTKKDQAVYFKKYRLKYITGKKNAERRRKYQERWKANQRKSEWDGGLPEYRCYWPF